ncbi:MAG: hypothetical protein HOH43_00355 [Candidatus Latescibacteria bacterium]|jgi:hypothetical protein|nr:hypothetical protein [Candidatus Latescibacterota bacterium]
MSRFELTDQQKRYFSDFGYIFLPGLMAEEIDWITEEYERAFRDHGVNHDGTQRSSLGKIIERSETMYRLIDHPNVTGLLAGLLGDDYNYLGSGADLYVGDGMWHPDCHDAPIRQVKWAMYLDPLTKDSGALRVVPGSHKQRWVGNLDTQDLWGISDEEVPCHVPVNTPGDVMVFDLQTLHNSVSGGRRRRMLNLVAGAHCSTQSEKDFLTRRIPGSRDELMWDRLVETAGEERMKHLRQPWGIHG